MPPQLPLTWSETEASRVLGPVACVCAPNRFGYLALTVFLPLVHLGHLVMCLGLGLGFSLAQDDRFLLPLVGLLAAWVAGALPLMSSLQHHLNARLILGANGVAIWTPREV